MPGWNSFRQSPEGAGQPVREEADTTFLLPAAPSLLHFPFIFFFGLFGYFCYFGLSGCMISIMAAPGLL